MARMPGVPFHPPKSFTRGRPAGPPRFLCIHYTAGSEGPSSAEDGVAYDQRRTDGTSAHFYCDRDSIAQCVDTDDRSHTARWGGNNLGIHIEQCGTAQTRAQWLDEASRATIRNTARICAWAMAAHDIPLVRLVGRQVRAGRGLCGHGDVTIGFPEDGGTHTDPGAQYPWDVLFADIRSYLNPTELTGIESDMTPEQNRILENIQGRVGEVYNILSALKAQDKTAAANAAASSTRDAATVAAITALSRALSAGSGAAVDTAMILAAIDAQAEKTRVLALARTEETVKALSAAAAVLGGQGSD